MSTISAKRSRTLIYHALADRLKAFGFQMISDEGIFQRSRNALQQRITILSDVIRGVSKQHLICSANLSVQHLSTDAIDFPSSSNWTQTVTRNIGYLLPQRCWKEWMVDLSASVQPKINEFADTISQVGISWFEQFENQDSEDFQQPESIEHPVASYYRRSESSSGEFAAD